MYFMDLIMAPCSPILAFIRRQSKPTILEETKKKLEDLDEKIGKEKNHITAIQIELQKRKMILQVERNPTNRTKIQTEMKTCLVELKKANELLSTLENQHAYLEKMLFTSEQTDHNVSHLVHEKKLAAHLKKQHKNLNAEDIDKIRDETEDVMENAQRISELFSQPIQLPGTSTDQDLLDAELMEYLNEIDDPVDHGPTPLTMDIYSNPSSSNQTQIPSSSYLHSIPSSSNQTSPIPSSSSNLSTARYTRPSHTQPLRTDSIGLFN